MYKAIIFDFFGVFCPDITLEWFKKDVADWETKLPSFQAVCTRSDYGKISRDDFFKEVSKLAGVSAHEMTKGVEAQTAINSELVTLVTQLQGNGYKIACLSNGTHEWTLRVINDHGLGNIFDKIVLSGDIGIVKPDPRIYQKALASLDVTASEAIFIDDRQVNVEAGEACGIHSFVFTSTE